MGTKIKRNKVEVFKERLFCECGTEMNPTHESTTPSIHMHLCPACKQGAALSLQYPKIVYKEIRPEKKPVMPRKAQRNIKEDQNGRNS